jgi:hypothetical protein
MRVLVLCAALVSATPALAQTPRDCGSLWKEADTDANGSLTQQEDRRGYFDAFKVAGRTTLVAGVISRDEFMLYCDGGLDRSAAGARQQKGTEAPIDRGKGDLTPGLIPFPKDEAMRRLQASGYRDLGDLVLDAKGIWRTTGMLNGKRIEIAVDVQGDVVAGG